MPPCLVANDVGQTAPTTRDWVFGSWLKNFPGSVTLPGPMGSTSTNKEMRDWLEETRHFLPESSNITRVITALSLEPARRRYWIHRQTPSSETRNDTRNDVTGAKHREWAGSSSVGQGTKEGKQSWGSRANYYWNVKNQKWLKQRTYAAPVHRKDPC